MGLYLINIASFFYIENQFPKEDQMHIMGKIISIKEEKEYYNKYILKIIKNQNYEKTKNQKIIIYVEKENDFFPGDIITVKGKFEKSSDSKNYKGFSYRKYLLQNKIFGTMKCESVEKIGESRDIYIKILLLRLEFCNQINNIFKEDIAQFLNGLLFGKIDELAEEVEENFEISNISHILAISGMHVTYVVLGMKFIVEKFINNKKVCNLILIVFIFVFYIITGSAVSCLRACLMSALIFISSSLYRKNNFYISFVFSLLFILLLNPYNLYNIGMWLSYFGTLGIVVFYNFLKRFWDYYSNRFSRRIDKKIKIKIITEAEKTNKESFLINFLNIKNKILNYILENFLLSISAQILIFPIMVYAFNTISFTFFISNILVSVFIALALIFGYFTVFVSYIPIPFYKVFLLIEEIMISIILKIGEICAKIPFSRIYVPTPNFIFILLYYIVIFCLVLYFNKRKNYCLKLIMSFAFLKKEVKNYFKLIISKINKFTNNINIKNNYKNDKSDNNNDNNNNDNNNNNNDIDIMRKINKLINLEKMILKKKIISSIINIFFVIFILIFILISINSSLKIYFIDVGQGDCTVIQTPNNKNIIIDGGEGNTDKYDYGENVVLPYLLDRGITKIDYLIISHCDSDHIGGLFAVLENLKVEQVLIGIQPEPSEQFEALIKIANKKKIEIKFLKAGDVLKLDENIKIEVLWPIKNELIEENALNNNSLVFKLCYKEFSILFTGDIEEVAEREIVKIYDKQSLKASVLKVAHHGSKTSSTNEFLEMVKPEIALIGVGEDNKFGHPSEDILKLLNYFNVKIYRTDINGEIVIKIKDNKINVKSNFE
ncbi:MAG: ComEC/Rec2 family competence protein [Clostridia bacterium]|nr:ComEC/Rec2 family competence protein [Clostridia bacterium]